MRVTGKGVGIGWLVARVKTKKCDNVNGRFRMAMTTTYIYTQQVNNPLQDLDRCVLTVGAISGLHY